MSSQWSSLPRLPTGVVGLDTVLGGGVLQGGVYLIAGKPGVGKTILANQICFHQIAGGGRALFVTLLAESHSRMLAHMSSLAFFDPVPIATSLIYLSGIDILEREGLKGLLQLLRRELQTHGANVLVIDGIGAAWSSAQNELEIKHFVHRLQALLVASGCTAFLLGQRDTRKDQSEQTIVDGIIDLSQEPVDVRTLRFLEVIKFRGSDYLAGRHIYEISNAGMVVYPRTELLLDSPLPVGERRERTLFGVAGLDAMLQGGLLAGSTTGLMGSAGSGKTIASLHFLAAGLAVGQPGLYFGFAEPPPRLIAKADAIGLDFSAAIASGSLEVIWFPPLEQHFDMLAVTLIEAVRRRGVKRLVVDGLNAFQQAAVHIERLGRFFTALTNALRNEQITSIFTVETPDLFGNTVEWQVHGVTLIAENILYMRYIVRHGQLIRLLSLLKVRDSSHDTTLRVFTIGAQGMEIGDVFTSAKMIGDLDVEQSGDIYGQSEEGPSS